MSINWQRYKELEQIAAHEPQPASAPMLLQLLFPLRRRIVAVTLLKLSTQQRRQHLEGCLTPKLDSAEHRCEKRDLREAKPSHQQDYGVSRANLMATWL